MWVVLVEGLADWEQNMASSRLSGEPCPVRLSGEVLVGEGLLLQGLGLRP